MFQGQGEEQEYSEMDDNLGMLLKSGSLSYPLSDNDKELNSLIHLLSGEASDEERIDVHHNDNNSNHQDEDLKSLIHLLSVEEGADEGTSSSDDLGHMISLLAAQTEGEEDSLHMDHNTLGDLLRVGGFSTQQEGDSSSSSAEDDNYEPSEDDEDCSDCPVPVFLPLPQPRVFLDTPPREDIIRKIMCCPELWIHALENYQSVASGQWLDYGVLNFCLLRMWYSVSQCCVVGFLDTASLECGEDPYLEMFTIPRFRARFFLPPVGPCPLRPLVFIARELNHFFSVYMDHAQKKIFVLGKTSQGSEDRWESWRGPELYGHICMLHGWDCDNISDVVVEYVSWRMNGYDCGPVAIRVCTHIFEHGYHPPDAERDVQRTAESCHHITRLSIHEFMRTHFSNVSKDYAYYRTHPPEEWNLLEAGDAQKTYGEMGGNYTRLLDSLQDPRDPIIEGLHLDISGCHQCIHLHRPVHGHPIHSRSHGGRDRSKTQDMQDDMEDDVRECGHPTEGLKTEESGRNLPQLDSTRTRPLRILKVSCEDMAIERKRRISKPCDLPEPPRPRWPDLDPNFDDYFGGPTQEDKRAFEESPHNIFQLNHHSSSQLTQITSHWTSFRDYGYRLLPRFAHAFYLCDPMKLEEHVMPNVPLAHSFDPSAHFVDMHITPRPIGRTGIPELRTVYSSDVELLGAKEMTERVIGKDGQLDYSLLISYFVQGKTEAGKYICVDLERDAIPTSRFVLGSTVDIDSFVWVTRTPRVAGSVGLMVTPSIKGTGGIKKHNHVYVELLEPPTEEEVRDGPSHRSWIERSIPLSNIPHTLFTKVTSGNSPVNCYIFFPRMMHRYEHGRLAVNIPLVVTTLFWNTFVLPALRMVVENTPLEPFYEFTVDNNLRKAGGKAKPEAALWEGMSKQVHPDTFLGVVRNIKELLETHPNQELAGRFQSFFFVFECKGFKLSAIDTDGEKVKQLLKSGLPQMDWNYAFDRNNGELYLDVGFTYTPSRLQSVAKDDHNSNDIEESGVTGIWRLDYLEESFGKAGFKAGTAHHINNLDRYGAIQAEMGAERSRRAHVTYRCSYNTQYEAVRKRDNNPWFCEDSDAYKLSKTFLAACEGRKEQYGGRDDRTYSPRDEYRASGQAAMSLLDSKNEIVDRFNRFNGVLWLPTQVWFKFNSLRLEALQTAIGHVHDMEPPNQGVIISLLMYLIRSIDSTPTLVPSFVRRSLDAVGASQIRKRFGMIFLHDLRLTNDEASLLEVMEEDDIDVLSHVESTARSRARGPNLHTHDMPSTDFPLGKHPTWTQLKDMVSKNPLRITRAWDPPSFISGTSTRAGMLFVKFTRSFWALLKADFLSPGLPVAIENLDQAMKGWSVRSVMSAIRDPAFVLNRADIPGSVPGGKECLTFKERFRIYFPISDSPPKPGSKWMPFFSERVGYIAQYHKDKASLDPDGKGNLDREIENLFNNVQCLPDSDVPTQKGKGHGRTWGRENSGDRLSVLVNPRQLKFVSVGKKPSVKTAPTRPHVTRANKEVLQDLLRQEGLHQDALRVDARDRRGRRRKENQGRSGRAKNARKPPEQKGGNRTLRHTSTVDDEMGWLEGIQETSPSPSLSFTGGNEDLEYDD